MLQFVRPVQQPPQLQANRGGIMLDAHNPEHLGANIKELEKLMKILEGVVDLNDQVDISKTWRA